MKKLLRNSIAVAFLAVTTSSLASCGAKRLEFWSSFGAAYTNYLDEIVEKIKSETGYDIHHVSKGSYDGIKTAVDSSRTTNDYPSLMTGYPDHFAGYLGGKILVQLNDYIDKYNAQHGGNLLDDYYDDYMVENTELDVYTAADGTKKAAVSALPFNKSTELMGYNATFVSYCADLCKNSQLDLVPADDLGTVPATWQEWKVKGPKYRKVLLSLTNQVDSSGKTIKDTGHVLWFDQAEDGSASNFSVDEQGTRKSKLDFTQVDPKDVRVLTWDSTDNMFITLVRQWDSEYTSLPSTEMKKDPRRRQGHIRFNTPNNVEKTVACMHFFNQMNAKGIFGVPSQLGASYSSASFASNEVMFMICSSGGLSYNTDSWTQRFTVAPVPYNAEATSSNGKFVISQGANIALSKQGGDDMIQKGFETMVKLTTGENQAKWCLNTGYYPCSKSATNDPAYQAFLADTSYDDPTVVAYREGSVLNEEHYMNKDEGWHKFVDPAFGASSAVRTQCKTIFESVFSSVVLNEDGTVNDAESSKTYKQILKEVCDYFATENRVVVDTED